MFLKTGSETCPVRLGSSPVPRVMAGRPLNNWPFSQGRSERYKRKCAFPAMFVSELHRNNLCRTDPVAPALQCADLASAASRRKVVRLCDWRQFIPSQ
jgi:hypothetical protein